ncbi:hypothetical protein M514_09565 [Trichuris suis]|uniref:Peptidase M14 domain-containing protein n=1 Tax=Trichuris suis TaxID=68888 RepID=A0A085NLF8_9BILA|nr:hypothetical protein M514_09565 [Trichuris suis]
MKSQALFCFTLWLYSLHTLSHSDAETKRQQLFHVHPVSMRQVEILNKLRRNATIEADFLRPSVKIGSSVPILVAKKSSPLLLQILKSSSIEFADKTDELVRFLAHHQTMAKNYKWNDAQNGYDFFSFETYHPLKEIHGFLKAIQRKFPSITEVVKIGASYEGREMLAIRIGKLKTNKIIWVDAGTHAREWIGPATAVYLINRLTENYGKNPTVTELVNKFNFYILPVLNPDGYEYSWTTNRLWRKSRAKNDCTFDTCCYGVDLNKNFPFAFEANLNPCRSDYSGPYYFSEPETKAMHEFFREIYGQVLLYLTLHSYGQYLEMPYGMEPTEPPHLPKLMAVGRSFIQGASFYKKHYYLISTYKHDPIAGQAIDWAMFTRDIPFAFSLLQRPYEDDEWGFELPKDQILPASAFHGLVAMVNKAEQYANSTDFAKRK